MAVDAVERGLRFGGAIIVASLAAGPIFWLWLVLTSLPDVSGAGVAPGLIWFAILTIPYGFMLSFLPNLIGTAVMTTLGAWFGLARSPLAWIAAGALGGALCAWIFGGAGTAELQFLASLMLTGAACAAICRAFTRWSDWDGDAQA